MAHSGIAGLIEVFISVEAEFLRDWMILPTCDFPDRM
jgi:hypothetical protein